MPTIGPAARLALTVLLAAGPVCAQQPFREYPSIEAGWSGARRGLTYPADAAHLAVELGVNFALYALTH
jgi:hypothetical protein